MIYIDLSSFSCEYHIVPNPGMGGSSREKEREQEKKIKEMFNIIMKLNTHSEIVTEDLFVGHLSHPRYEIFYMLKGHSVLGMALW